MAIVPVTSGKHGKVAVYDFKEVARQSRNWVLGQFVTDENGVPLTEVFEVKIHEGKAGEARGDWSSDAQGCAFTLVLKGSLESTMAPNGIEGLHEIARVGPGGCVFWDNTVPHKWRVLEDDTMIVTVRVK
jgi:hypothetical protein